MFTIDGLVSGLDTSSIITDLVAIQENQINRLTARKDLILAEQTAFQGIEARILGLRSSMSRLNRTTSSVFDQRIAVSSDDQALTAVAGNDAIEGTFQIQVNSLAKAHQIGSNGFESTSSTITEGTISFRLGDRPETTIEIDGTNNTVSGLVSAINNQSDDINATIINDPSSGQSRILLTSRFTGRGKPDYRRQQPRCRLRGYRASRLHRSSDPGSGRRNGPARIRSWSNHRQLCDQRSRWVD